MGVLTLVDALFIFLGKVMKNDAMYEEVIKRSDPDRALYNGKFCFEIKIILLVAKYFFKIIYIRAGSSALFLCNSVKKQPIL